MRAVKLTDMRGCAVALKSVFTSAKHANRMENSAQLRLVTWWGAAWREPAPCGWHGVEPSLWQWPEVKVTAFGAHRDLGEKRHRSASATPLFSNSCSARRVKLVSWSVGVVAERECGRGCVHRELGLSEAVLLVGEDLGQSGLKRCHVHKPKEKNFTPLATLQRRVQKKEPRR
jgi:hypothetical protein